MGYLPAALLFAAIYDKINSNQIVWQMRNRLCEFRGASSKQSYLRMEISMATKYYAVKVGKKPGIYRTWDECKKMVHGYPGAVYKSFTVLKDAQNFIGISDDIPMHAKMDDAQSMECDGSEAFAFVDGSFNISTKVYGYGGFLKYNGDKILLKGSGSDKDMASMRNVAGEILGSMAAVKKALELGIKKINIYYDYMGIQMWAEGAWKRNKKGTIEYYDFMNSVKKDIEIKFIKVKGHSGVEGNEEADRLAKEAVGIL